MRTVLSWAWFAAVQAISLIAMALGWFVLIPFCCARAWTLDGKSVKDGRPVDRWTWKPLNLAFGNPEDGVSGACALIWNDAGQQVAYMPDADPRWRAYCWSAWRNSADNLKYAFARKGGPFKRWERGGWYVQAGYNADGFPVISAGRR